MLPFLKPKSQSVGMIVQKRTPDGSIDNAVDESGDPAMEACAEDIMRAIANKDAKALAFAIKSAFECMDSAEEPSEE